MPLARLGLALAASLLTACTVAGTTRVAGPSEAPVAPTRKPTATPGASAPPSSGPSAAAAATPAPLRRLAPPAAGRVVLRGRVRLDGAYLVASGAAVVSNSGAGVLSNAGARLISDHGAGILTDAGGGLVVPDAAAIIADNRGSVISDYGLGIGQGLISDNGAVMIGKTKFYGLFQAPDPGALQPAGGLVVGLASLRRSELLPVGRDAAGADAYGVYTDAAGGWEVSLPAEEAGNVLVLVRLPGQAWDLVTPAGAAEAIVDEDTSLAAQYLLSAYVNRFRDLMTTPDPDALAAQIAGRWVGAPPALRELTVALIKEFRAVADEVGLSTAPRAEAERVSRRLVNAVLARVALDQVRVTQAANAQWRGPDEPALPALAGALRHARVKAAQALARDPQAFDKLPFFAAANQGKRARGEAPYAIRKGSDFGDFFVREYLSGELQASYVLATTAFTAIDALVDPATGQNQVDRVAGAQGAVMTEIGRKLLLDEDGAKTEALAILRAYRP